VNKLPLFLLVFSGLMYSACVEDEIVMQAVPCEWEATFSSIPDTCFDLPRNPNGSVFTASHGPSHSFSSPIFNTVSDGSMYYVKADRPNFNEIQLIRKNLCPSNIEPEFTKTLPAIINIKVNQNGNLLFSPSYGVLVMYDPNTDIIDTVFSDRPLIDHFWISETTCGASVFNEAISGTQYFVFNNDGEVIDTLPIYSGNTSNQNDRYFAHYRSSGPIPIFSTETLELVKSIPRPDDFNGAIRTTWIDNERLLLLGLKKLSLINIETEEEQVLLNYSGCENIGFHSVTSDPFDHDRILISRFDHYHNEDGQLRREERISYYNITTGEEQILELE
jgi:hypothetical protein